MKKKYLITTPIYYPNDKPHIGSCHTTILADFINRALKKFGYDSKLLTGTDEHGDKIYNTVLQNSINNELYSLEKQIKDFLDKKADLFKEIFELLDIEYDKFIRTTDKDHEERVKNCWTKLVDCGLIYKGLYGGYYSIRDETFYEESQLIDGKSPYGDIVKYEEFSCYFLKASFFENKIKQYYLNNKITSPINRQNALEQYIEKELKDFCISRPNSKWGIDIPNDSGKIYVWFDALLNYLCLWEDREVIHILAKDILIFHGLHWPILLMALDIRLFSKIFVHNWWLMDNEKMSKSLKNIIDPWELVNKYGKDAVRFYIIKENLINSDGDFLESKLCEYYNSFLVNKFSNLVYRVESLMKKHNIPIIKNSILINIDNELEICILEQNINEYIRILFNKIDDLNTTIEKEKLWTNPQMSSTIHISIQEIIHYIEPIVPSVSKYWNENDIYMIFKPIIY